MKKLLSSLGTVVLITSGCCNLMTCSNKNTQEELIQLKEKNKINTDNQEIKNNLEWIAPQEKPFNKVDEKWYFIIWKTDKWKIDKIFRDYNIDVGKEYYLYKDNNYELKFFRTINSIDRIGDASLFYVCENPFNFRKWGEINSDYFNFIKSVYRWNLNTLKPDLIVDNDGNIKVNE